MRLLRENAFKMNPYSNDLTLFAMLGQYHLNFLTTLAEQWKEKQLTIIDFQKTIESIERENSKSFLTQVNNAI